MISVRVNEIFQYLSTDKKERLKQCALLMERNAMPRKDNNNVRVQQNNLNNATTTTTSSTATSDCDDRDRRETRSETETTKGSDFVFATANSHRKEAKNRKKIQNKAVDEERLERGSDFKKRRPLSVLKCDNLQQLQSASRDSSAALPSSLSQSFIPKCASPSVETQSSSSSLRKHSSIPAKSVDTSLVSPTWPPLPSVKTFTQDRKLTGKRCPIPIPAAPLESVTNEKPAKHQLSKKQSKRKNNNKNKNITSKQEQEQTFDVDKLSSSSSETSTSDVVVVTGGRHDDPTTRLSSADERGKKRERALPPCDDRRIEAVILADLNAPLEGPSRRAAQDVAIASTRQRSKLPSGNGDFDNDDDRRRLDVVCKDKKTRNVKNRFVEAINACSSKSGVAELDTFEIISKRNGRLSKNRMSSSHRVNSLDTFEEPAYSLSNGHMSSSPASLSSNESDEHWIEVNRKIKRISIPQNVVNRILGSDGSKLEAICRVTKAQIEIERSTDSTGPTFVIRGSAEQMQAAYSVIKMLIKDHAPSDSIRCVDDESRRQKIDGVFRRRATDTTQDLENRERSSSCVTVPTPTTSPVLSFLDDPPSEREDDDDPVVLFYDQRSDGSADSTRSSSERSDPGGVFVRPFGREPPAEREYLLFDCRGFGQPLETLLAGREERSEPPRAIDGGLFSAARSSACLRTSNAMLARVLPGYDAYAAADRDQALLAKAPGYRSGGGGGPFGPVVHVPETFPATTTTADEEAEASRMRCWRALMGYKDEKVKVKDKIGGGLSINRLLHSVPCQLVDSLGDGNTSRRHQRQQQFSDAAVKRVQGFEEASSIDTSSDGPFSDHPLLLSDVDRPSQTSSNRPPRTTLSKLNPNAPDFVFSTYADAGCHGVVADERRDGGGSSPAAAASSREGSPISRSLGVESSSYYGFDLTTTDPVNSFNPSLSFPRFTNIGDRQSSEDMTVSVAGDVLNPAKYFSCDEEDSGSSATSSVPPWLSSRVDRSWSPAKVSYGGAVETTLVGGNDGYLSEVVNRVPPGYFATPHPAFGTAAFSPYGSAFCQLQQQQQHQEPMLMGCLPMQTWSHISSAVAMTGP